MSLCLLAVIIVCAAIVACIYTFVDGKMSEWYLRGRKVKVELDYVGDDSEAVLECIKALLQRLGMIVCDDCRLKVRFILKKEVGKRRTIDQATGQMESVDTKLSPGFYGLAIEVGIYYTVDCTIVMNAKPKEGQNPFWAFVPELRYDLARAVFRACSLAAKDKVER